MKKVLVFLCMFMFLVSTALFAGNAASLKVAIKYKNAAGDYAVLNQGDNATVEVFAYLLDANGAPATAGPNGESLSGLSFSVTSTLLGTDLDKYETFDTTSTDNTINFGNGATARFLLKYTGLLASDKISKSASSDKLTIAVGSLTTSGTINIKAPTAKYLVVRLPGNSDPTEASYVFQDVASSSSSFKHSDAGLDYRVPGSSVKFAVYSVTDLTSYKFSPNNSLNGKTITVKTTKGETATCTLDNGYCSGTITITKADNNTTQIVDVYGSYKDACGTSLLAGSMYDTTAKFKIESPKDIAVFTTDNHSVSKILISKIGVGDGFGDNATFKVCLVDKYGNIYVDADTPIDSDNISSNTSSGSYDNLSFRDMSGDNMSKFTDNSTTHGCLLVAIDNSTVGNAPKAPTGQGLATVTFTANNGTNYCSSDSPCTAKLYVGWDASDNISIQSSLASTTISAGDSVSFKLYDNGTTSGSTAPQDPYKVSDNWVFQFGNNSGNEDNGSCTITDTTSYWTVTCTLTKAATYDNLTIYDKTIDNSSNDYFYVKVTGISVTVQKDLNSATVKNLSLVTSAPSETGTTYVTSKTCSSSIPTAVNSYVVADGSTKNYIVSGSGFKVKDQYSNEITTNISSVSSELGSVTDNGSAYYVVYPTSAVGKTDTLTVAGSGASTTITVDNIVAKASALDVSVVGPDWSSFAGSYYAGSEVMIKVTSNGYLSSSKSFKLTTTSDVSGIILNEYDTSSVTTSELTSNSTTGSLAAGYEKSKYYIIYVPEAGDVTISVSDTATSNTLTSDNLTLTFANQDKTAPTVGTPEVIEGGIKFTVSDDVAVASVTATVADSDGNSYDSTVAQDSDNASYWKVTGLAAGTYIFTITAKDAEGNSTEKQYVREVTESAPTCDSTHLSLCTTETDCTGASGVWDDNTSTCSAPASTSAAPSSSLEPSDTAPETLTEVTATVGSTVDIKPQLTVSSGDTPANYYAAMTFDGGTTYYFLNGTTWSTTFGAIDSSLVTLADGVATFDLVSGATLSDALSGLAVDFYFGYDTGANYAGLKFSGFELKIQ